MRSDLVAVLSDSTLRDHTDECTQLLSRTFPESQRADWIDALAKEAAQADESNNAELAQALVAKLINAATTMVEGTEREVEGMYNLLMALLVQHVPSTDAAFGELVHKLAHSVSDEASASVRSVLKYRILANLFNTLNSSSPLRLDVFTHLLDMVVANGDLDFLDAALQSLPTWLAEWDVSIDKKHNCLSRVASALQGIDSVPENVDKLYQCERLHLRFLSAEPSLSADTRRDAAEQALANILRLPKLFEMEELLQIPATLELGDQAPMRQLLDIVVGGARSDLEAWVPKNKDALQRFELDEDALRHKMRLLDLAALCAESVSSEVSYDELARTLDVPSSDVETWVIDVIRAGLVSGKLSQVKQSFRVYRSTYRTFDKPQWESLEQRLTQWQKSIAALRKSMDNTTQQVPSALQSSADDSVAA